MPRLTSHFPLLYSTPAGRYFLGTFFALLLILLSSCNRAGRADLVFINGPEPQSLDPAVITGQVEGRIAKALFEGLTARDAEGNVIPAVASSWETSSDGLSYTFHLRPDIKWSNGDALTSKDFLESWKRVLTPATASRYAYILYPIKNAEFYHKGTLKDFSQVGISAPDPLTLNVTLHSPTPYFPDLVAFTTYLPIHIPTIEKYGMNWTKPENIVSNGPYKLLSWRINDRICFIKNPLYRDAENVRLNRIDALAVAKASTAFNLYATHQADLILDKSLIPPTLIETLKQQPDFHANPFLATYYYRLNTTRPPFNDPRIRKAFTLATDKERIVRKITKAGELPANSLTPPGIPGYTPPEGISYNPEEARQLLSQAGFPDGKDFPFVSILYNQSDLNEQIATEIQAMWQENLNVRVELRNQEWATYLKSLDTLDYDIARSSWLGDYNDPNTFLDCFITGCGNNRTGWSNEEYDSLLKQANRTLDSEKRFRLLQKAEKILIEDDLPILPIYFLVGTNLYDGSKLAGIHPNVVDEHPLQYLYWKQIP